MGFKNVVGIDPGISGGWAAMKLGTNFVAFGKMPLIGKEISVAPLAEFISKLGEKSETIVLIEKVHAMPKQGVSSTFTFGMGYGKLLGMCQILGVSFDLVPPQKWKKSVLENTKKDKEAAIEYVARLFPDVKLIPEGCRKPHNGIADAVCIMQWGIEKYGQG